MMQSAACSLSVVALWLLAVTPAWAAESGASPPRSLPAAAPSAAAPASGPAASALLAQRAGQLFDEGVKLASEGHFALARAAFRGAYELQPHPSVLYNIAQCEVRLGDVPAAAATLARFLDSSGPELDPERRRAVERQLAELQALRGSQPAAPAGAIAAASPPLSTAPPPAPPASAPALRPFVLGGTGVTLLGTAAGLYLWNQGRRDSWRAQRDELASTPGFSSQLARDPVLWDRAQASNERLDAIRTLDLVTLLVTGAGLAALGAGAWDLWASDEPPSLELGCAPFLRWHGRW